MSYAKIILSKYEKAQLQVLNKKAWNYRTICYNPKCKSNDKRAINSHVLQKNGVLNKIADQHSNIWELDITDFFESDYVMLKSNHINNSKAFTFFGFCNYCDTNIFKEVEERIPNLIDNYKHQLLFNYRSLVHELYKVDKTLLYYDYVENSNLRPQIKEMYKSKKFVYSCSRKILKSMKEKIENDLFQPCLFRVFSFVRRASCYFYPILIQRLPITVSGTYSSNRHSVIRNDGDLLKIPVHFIHVIPYKNNNTMVLFGCSKDNSNFFTGIQYSELKNSSEELIQAIITDVILQRVETWGISVDFYKTLSIKKKIDKIIRLKNESIESRNNSSLNFNIFV